MSDSESTSKSSADNQPANVAAPADRKKKSSRAGRIVIGLLLVVLAVEAIAHFRVTSASSKLSKELARAEAEKHMVTREAVKEILGGREPDESKLKKVAAGEELYDVYRFSGLLKTRVLCVHYSVEGQQGAEGSGREMMEVMTGVPEEILYDDGPAGE